MDKTDKRALIERINTDYIGRRLKDVKLYVLNYKFPFENKQGWHLCDSAIELTFDEDTYFTFCFDEEWELLDFFNRPYLEIYPDAEAKLFQQTRQGLWSPFIENTLEDIDIHWNWYEDFEENTYHVPQVIRFEFIDGKKFIIAAVEVGFEDKSITLNLDSEGEIIIGFTQEIWSIISDEILRLE